MMTRIALLLVTLLAAARFVRAEPATRPDQPEIQRQIDSVRSIVRLIRDEGNWTDPERTKHGDVADLLSRRLDALQLASNGQYADSIAAAARLPDEKLDLGHLLALVRFRANVGDASGAQKLADLLALNVRADGYGLASRAALASGDRPLYLAIRQKQIDTLRSRLRSNSPPQLKAAVNLKIEELEGVPVQVSTHELEALRAKLQSTQTDPADKAMIREQLVRMGDQVGPEDFELRLRLADMLLDVDKPAALQILSKTKVPANYQTWPQYERRLQTMRARAGDPAALEVIAGPGATLPAVPPPGAGSSPHLTLTRAQELWDAGDHAAALATVRTALAEGERLTSRVPGATERGRIHLLNRAGSLLSDWDELTFAAEVLERAVDGAEKLQANAPGRPPDPTLSRSTQQLFLVRLKQKRYNDALSLANLMNGPPLRLYSSIYHVGLNQINDGELDAAATTLQLLPVEVSQTIPPVAVALTAKLRARLSEAQATKADKPAVTALVREMVAMSKKLTHIEVLEPLQQGIATLAAVDTPAAALAAMDEAFGPATNAANGGRRYIALELARAKKLDDAKQVAASMADNSPDAKQLRDQTLAELPAPPPRPALVLATTRPSSRGRVSSATRPVGPDEPSGPTPLTAADVQGAIRLARSAPDAAGRAKALAKLGNLLTDHIIDGRGVPGFDVPR